MPEYKNDAANADYANIERPKRTLPAKLLTSALSAGLVLSAGGYVTEHNQSTRLKHHVTAEEESTKHLAAVNSNLQQQLKQQQAQSKRMGEILGNLTGVDSKVVSGQGLTSIDKLPGYGQPVSPELRRKLQSATVELGIRPKGTNAAWQPFCTAVKVSDGQTNFIVTARHCLNDSINFPQKGSPLPAAENVTSLLTSDFAVLDPNLSLAERVARPLASINNVAIDTTGTADWAILKPAANSQTTNFSEQSPLHISDVLAYDNAFRPLPGSDVALFGLPQISGFEPVIGTGKYIGRMFINGAHFSGWYDFVGLHAQTPQADNCQFGTSGSVAMFNNGHLSGPLSFHDNLGYGYSHKIISGDNLKVEQQDYLDYEQMFNIDLQNFTSVCGYSVPLPDTVTDLKKVLSNPNDVVYPPMLMK